MFGIVDHDKGIRASGKSEFFAPKGKILADTSFIIPDGMVWRCRIRLYGAGGGGAGGGGNVGGGSGGGGGYFGYTDSDVPVFLESGVVRIYIGAPGPGAVYGNTPTADGGDTYLTLTGRGVEKRIFLAGGGKRGIFTNPLTHGSGGSGLFDGGVATSLGQSPYSGGPLGNGSLGASNGADDNSLARGGAGDTKISGGNSSFHGDPGGPGYAVIF